VLQRLLPPLFQLFDIGRNRPDLKPIYKDAFDPTKAVEKFLARSRMQRFACAAVLRQTSLDVHQDKVRVIEKEKEKEEHRRKEMKREIDR
jgi:hypothetical protein